RRVERPVVYAADLSLLQAVHGLEDMKAWVRHMNGRCGAKGGALILASVDRELAEQVEKDSVPSEGLQAMLESLANPIRRAVVAYVVASGPVAYSGILKKNFVDSSSKLSFYLQKLQSDGLLARGDADGVRENLAELFELVGYSVLTAANATEAMEALRNREVDLLLTDFRMPGPNGVELIESARRAKPGLRAVLMTAFGDTFTEIESVRRGAIGYLNKPFEADEITGLVARILALKRE